MTAGAHSDETSAGGVVYRVDGGRPLYLLICDSHQNWGFPKGHVEPGEQTEAAALREVAEETGLTDLALRGAVGAIDWHFRFRGRVIHKTCHFYLMESAGTDTYPQHAEGITACRWTAFDEAESLISYTNAREILRRANDLVGTTAPAP